MTRKRMSSFGTGFKRLSLLFIIASASAALAGPPPKGPEDCEDAGTSQLEQGEAPKQQGNFVAVKVPTEKQREKLQAQLIKTYTRSSKEIGRTITIDELAVALGQDIKTVRNYFGEAEDAVFATFEELKLSSKEHNPKAFENTTDIDYFTEARLAALVNALEVRDRYILTTAVVGAAVSRPFLSALLLYCEKENADIFIFPANGQTEGLDGILFNHPRIHIITNTIRLSPLLALNKIRQPAKNDDQLMGLNTVDSTGELDGNYRTTIRDQSYPESQIMAGPKPQLVTVATNDNTYAHRFGMATGAITYPNYNGQHEVQKRTDTKALNVHVVSAMDVEKSLGTTSLVKLGNETGFYNYRHIYYVPEIYGFTDLNKVYCFDYTPIAKSDYDSLEDRQLIYSKETGVAYAKDPIVDYKKGRVVGYEYSSLKPVVETFRPEAFIPGDIHVGGTDRKAWKQAIDYIMRFRPKRIVLHDLFNGHSISHHDKDKSLTRAQLAQFGKKNLEKELRGVASFVNEILEIDKEIEIVIVGANHNDWLTRWSQLDHYSGSDENSILWNELRWARLGHGFKNPLEYLLVHRGENYPEHNKAMQTPMISNPDRVTFQPRERNYKVGPKYRKVEVNLHGDLGANGAKGSVKTFKVGIKSSMSGHTHFVAVVGTTFVVGTSTPTEVDYSMGGLSNWSTGAGIINPWGKGQVLIYQHSEWYADPKVKNIPGDQFFQTGFPAVVPNTNPEADLGNGQGQVDQQSGVRRGPAK